MMMNPPTSIPVNSDADSLVPELSQMSSVGDSGYQSYDFNRSHSPRIVTSSPYVDDRNMSALYNHFKSSTPITSETRKPRVNFHSIQDLISDSGASLNFEEIQEEPMSRGSSQVENIAQAVEIQTNSRRRTRTNFTARQKNELEVWYKVTNQYPTSEQIEEIGNSLNLEPSVIRVWFQNKRARSRNQPKSKKSTVEPYAHVNQYEEQFL